MPTKNSRQSGHHPPESRAHEPRRRDTLRPQSSLLAVKIQDDLSNAGQTLSASTQQRAPDSDAYNCDDDELPLELRNSPYNTAKMEAHSQHNKRAQGPIGRVMGWFSPPKPTSKRPQQLYDNDNAAVHASRKVQGKNYTEAQESKGEDHDELAKVRQELARALKSHEVKELEFQKKMQDLQHQHMREIEHGASIQQTEIQNLKSDKEKLREEHEAFIRKQQELSFKQMTTSRWLPVEDTKVMADLNRLKREMRGWAKKTSMKDVDLLDSLDEGDQISLWNALAQVVRFEGCQISEEVRSLRSSTLLLNALLSHDVYTSLFRNPFFIFSEDLGAEHPFPGTGLNSMLGELYQRTQRSNEEDAHIWRSQTLRLLLPPLRNDTSDGEKELHNRTQEMITTVADRRASEFLKSPARYMISDKADANYGDKLRSIYREAASISYMLWTRRTTLRCWTLEDMGRPVFHPDSKELVPHSSVNFEEHEDQLEGRPITILVHPLLKAYGTDEAKDYDRDRVWAPAEVWLDSRN
ncbi:kinesin heavy chain protein [Rutstroemia sp. NJR-2017a WRK4]|nr:kinesin heavy chain protein [Rutstroemia sp. NJR-2017a WRK4]